MRIMHTSDWHIGKKTENTDRLKEQAQVLDEICDVAAEEGVELLLVAGDVFDTYIPSAEAEQLFYEKIVKLAKDRAVVIISGNHDDATRLCAAGPLAGSHGVYFSGDIYKNENLSGVTDGKVCLVESGEGYAVFANDKGEEVYVGMLPYPTEARFKERADGESHTQKIVGWMNKCLSSNDKGRPQILISHLFTVGGLTSDGEREISLGGAKAVDKNAFPDAAYVALGHLHKRQVVDSRRNIIYSGSILQYAFDEVNVEKSVTVFDIRGGKVENLHERKLSAGKKLARVSATSLEQAKEMLTGYENYLVELTLHLTAPLSREENNVLRSAYPNVISIKLEVCSSGDYSSRGRREMSDKKLFEECYLKQYGSDPEEDLTSLYLELLAEVECQ